MRHITYKKFIPQVMIFSVFLWVKVPLAISQTATSPESFSNCSCEEQIGEILIEQRRTNGFLAQLIQQCSFPSPMPTPTPITVSTTTSTTLQSPQRIIICRGLLRANDTHYIEQAFNQAYGVGNWEYGNPPNCRNDLPF